MTKAEFLSRVRQSKLKKRKSVKEYALDRLEKGGFVFASQPTTDNYYLTLPSEITNISDRDIGEYLNAFVQQKNWVLTLIATLEVEQMEIQESYELMYSEAYENSPYMNVNDKKEYANTRKNVRYWHNQLVKVNAVLTMASRNLETLDNAIFLLSREISRRTGLRDQETRSYNVGNVRKKE